MAIVSTTHWWEILARAGVKLDADAGSLGAKIQQLGLHYETVNGTPHGHANYAIVWAGGRPRDPEVAFGEARSETSLASALAEALGRFLVKDPGYPLR
jgi:hypothetical protein